jgi:hypothetical protein
MLFSKQMKKMEYPSLEIISITLFLIGVFKAIIMDLTHTIS